MNDCVEKCCYGIVIGLPALLFGGAFLVEVLILLGLWKSAKRRQAAEDSGASRRATPGESEAHE